MIRACWLSIPFLLLAACTGEKRASSASQPLTPPDGPGDPRIALVASNKYQQSQGGRYFTWYGCGTCHGDGARGYLDLGDGQWRRGGGFDRIYAAIARQHTPPYADRIPVAQLWQITAYVSSLTKLDPALRRRQDFDQKGEPQGTAWSGPVLR
jgi:mono/diheme cytochrome c family protein